MERSESIEINQSGYSLQDYRTAIRHAWLPVVGRKQFGSYEYELARRWFEENIPLGLVLKAIQLVVDRAKKKNTTIYSLGVISADLQRLLRERAEIQAGAHPAAEEKEGWRERWSDDLYRIADETDNPEFAAMCRELARDLGGLSEDQVEQRWAGIRKH
jgi:hypothetical protein